MDFPRFMRFQSRYFLVVNDAHTALNLFMYQGDIINQGKCDYNFVPLYYNNYLYYNMKFCDSPPCVIIRNIQLYDGKVLIKKSKTEGDLAC